jgi:hypothetical protein
LAPGIPPVSRSVNSARAVARKAACQNNLRQIGTGLIDHSLRSPTTTFCTGAFDWERDGVVTEVGWVADLLRVKIPTGEMLCPENPARAGATYTALLILDTAARGFSTCVNQMGSPARTASDGTVASLTSGPVLKTTRQPPVIPASTPQTGATGW